MKRKLIPIFLLCVVLLSACACEHEWVEANCTTPKTCSLCEETEGEPLGHSWLDATCTAPKTCEACGLTEGEALEHTWVDATCDAPKTCEVCGETEGEALGHNWTDATTDAPKTCNTCGLTEGEPLAPFTESISYNMLTSIFEEDFADFSPICGYDEEANMYMVVLIAPEGTAAGITNYPDEMRESWTVMCDSMNELSAAAYEAVVTEGYNVDCAVVLLSDLDQETFLLLSMNGDIYVDAMAEA